MRRILTLGLTVLLVAPAMAQEKRTTTERTVKESTTVRTTEHAVASSKVDSLGPPLWAFNDTTTVPPHRVDLRLTGKAVTASFPANGGHEHDDFVLIPHVVFGVCDNLEIAIANVDWVGNDGDVGPLRDGNYDTYVGALWRFKEQEGYCPSMALGGSLRVPTGDGSSGVDAELRLLLTNEYHSGIRSHINAFGTSVNGNNNDSIREEFMGQNSTWPDTRHFQWGIVVGLDGPLGCDGKLRWVADYMNRSSYHYGAGNLNLLDLGFEWSVSDHSALAVGTQIGLDDNEDTPNASVGLTYSHSLCW